MGMDSNKKQSMTAKEIAEFIAEEIRAITGTDGLSFTGRKEIRTRTRVRTGRSHIH